MRIFTAALALVFASTALRGESVALEKVMQMLSLPVLEWHGQHVTISDGTNSVSFRPGYRKISINGVAAWLNGETQSNFAKIMTMEREDVTKFLLPVLRGTEKKGEEKPFRVFIDPGHGGEDSGALSAHGGMAEKDLVLDLSRRIGERLESDGIEVAWSRTNDVFVALGERTELARRVSATLFLSIHANTASGKQARGAETFALPLAGFDSTSKDSRTGKQTRKGNAFDGENAILGMLVHAHLPKGALPQDRGFRRARFQVLRDAPCPAVLIECGFLSNEGEAASLMSERFRERFAVAVADAVKAYRENVFLP